MANADSFLKMTKKGAQDKAEKMNFLFRLIRIDGEAYHTYPEDVREDRVCVEIDNGVITKATIQ